MYHIFFIHSSVDGHLDGPLRHQGRPCPFFDWVAFCFFLSTLNLFIYLFLFLAVLGLRFCARAFSSCGERGPLFIVVHGPLTIAASVVAEHRLQTRRLSSCGSRAQLHVGSSQTRAQNPCPLHWQADSQPLHHQGSPGLFFDIKHELFVYFGD